MLGIVALPFVAAPIEARVGSPWDLRKVESSIEIAADAAAVWAAIERVPAIVEGPQLHRQLPACPIVEDHFIRTPEHRDARTMKLRCRVLRVAENAVCERQTDVLGLRGGRRQIAREAVLTQQRDRIHVARRSHGYFHREVTDGRTAR